MPYGDDDAGMSGWGEERRFRAGRRSRRVEAPGRSLVLVVLRSRGGWRRVRGRGTRRRRRSRARRRVPPWTRAWRPPCPPRTAAARRRTGRSARRPGRPRGSPSRGVSKRSSGPRRPRIPGTAWRAAARRRGSRATACADASAGVGARPGRRCPGEGRPGDPGARATRPPRGSAPTVAHWRAPRTPRASARAPPSGFPRRRSRRRGESPPSPSPPDRGLNARLSRSRTQDVMPGARGEPGRRGPRPVARPMCDTRGVCPYTRPCRGRGGGQSMSTTRQNGGPRRDRWRPVRRERSREGAAGARPRRARGGTRRRPARREARRARLRAAAGAPDRPRRLPRGDPGRERARVRRRPDAARCRPASRTATSSRATSPSSGSSR